MRIFRGRRDFALWVIFLAMVWLPRMAGAETKVVTNADKGGIVHLKVGDVLEVRLKSNPSTGFMWYVEKESTPQLKLAHQTQTKPAEPAAGEPMMVGQSIFQIFEFEPKRAGEGVLRLHYVQSWMKPAPEDVQFDLKVRIE